MSLDYDLELIVGYRVPRDKVWRDENETYYLCNHQFDRESIKFCPECGKPSAVKTRERSKFLLQINPDEIPQSYRKEWGDAAGEIIVDEQHNRHDDATNLDICLHHCIGEDEKDYVIGISIWQQETHQMSELSFLGKIEESDSINVKKAIQATWPEVSFNEDSFGLYVVQSCW